MVDQLTYRKQSWEFLRQAVQEIREGELRQGSEKAWGAAAQMLKAWADEKGLAHHSHPLLRTAATRLADEADNPELRDLFGKAESLHTNFYEGASDANEVAIALDDVARFVESVEALLPAE